MRTTMFGYNPNALHQVIQHQTPPAAYGVTACALIEAAYSQLRLAQGVTSLTGAGHPSYGACTGVHI